MSLLPQPILHQHLLLLQSTLQSNQIPPCPIDSSPQNHGPQQKSHNELRRWWYNNAHGNSNNKLSIINHRSVPPSAPSIAPNSTFTTDELCYHVSWFQLRMLLICLICLVFGCSVAIFVFCTPSPHQPSNGHISSSIRPIDPIFSAFFISIHLFWSDVDMN